METVFWFVESFRLNPGGKNSLCCLTAILICLFFVLRVNKTTSKTYLFQFRLFRVLRADVLGANGSLGAASPESQKTRTDRVWYIFYLEANLFTLTVVSLGSLSH